MIAILVALVFALLSLLHIHWAFGRRTAFSGVPERDGKPLFSPSRSSTLLVAGLLALAVLPPPSLLLPPLALVPVTPSHSRA